MARQLCRGLFCAAAGQRWRGWVSLGASVGKGPWSGPCQAGGLAAWIVVGTMLALWSCEADPRNMLQNSACCVSVLARLSRLCAGSTACGAARNSPPWQGSHYNHTRPQPWKGAGSVWGLEPWSRSSGSSLSALGRCKELMEKSSPPVCLVL